MENDQNLRRWTEVFLSRNGLDETERFFRKIKTKKWVVYAKAPFGGNDGLIRYLARYTHNIAISNHRIIDFNDQRVSFNYKDYRHGSQKKTMSLSTQEFVRRLSLHFLPKGFCRIRHYGMLSLAWKNRAFPQATKNKDINWQDFWKSKGLDVNKCSNCKNGTLIYLATLAPCAWTAYLPQIQYYGYYLKPFA